MKKILVVMLLVLVTMSFSACDLSEASFLYSETAEENGFSYGINRVGDSCFVSTYICEAYTEGIEITIPDEYDGVPVTCLGGYLNGKTANPFVIKLSDCEQAYNDVPIYRIKEPYVIKDISFVLHIGKNISDIEYVNMAKYYPYSNDDGTVTVYHPVVEIICAEENPLFYSKDGKLYDKKTEELITDFAYGVDVDREKVLDSFSFSFTWNAYGVSSYDSKTGRLVKTTDATHPSDYITTMFLSEDELVEIYTMLLKMDINSYPDSYDPINAPNAEIFTKSEPSMTIILDVYGESVGKSIRCSDIAMGTNGYDAKAQAFLDVCNRIEEIITDSDEWKALPRYEIFYE